MEPGRVRAGRVRSGGSGKAGDRREAGEKVQGKEKGPARASGAGEKRERREEAEGQGRGAEPLAERERERPTAEREEEARTRPRASPAPRPPPTEESKQILVLGLDGAGKTSVLHTLASNRVLRSVAPTQGFNAVSIDAGGSLMEFLEIGGSEPFRSSWEMHLSKGLLLIFVVDSADHSRLPEARKYLHQLIEANPVIPLDLQAAYHVMDILEALALPELGGDRQLFLLGTQATEKAASAGGPSTMEDARDLIAHLAAGGP